MEWGRCLPGTGPDAAGHYCSVIRPLVLAGLALALAACGAIGSSSGAVVARSGSLEVQGPYLPQPASPDVAAAYFTLKNNGAIPDTLLAADSPAAAYALPMSSGEGTDQGGMGLMTGVPLGPILGSNGP